MGSLNFLTHRYMTGEQTIQSLRISVPLNMDDLSQNVINYAELRDSHLQKSGVLQESSEDEAESDEAAPDQPQPIKTKRKYTKKFDPELEYDLNDDFIDDSDMFITERNGIAAPVDWDFGYFVYKGPLEQFLTQP